MEQQSSLDEMSEQMTRVLCCSLILDSSKFATVLCNFPGGNCIPDWAEHGTFFLSCTLYNGGRACGVFHTKSCTESGYIEINFDTVFACLDHPVDGIMMIEIAHPSKVPVEIYLSHIHRATQCYVAYPAGTFIGDTIYTEAHAAEIENTQFWPGIVSDVHSEMGLFVINPYSTPFGYEVTLYLPGNQKIKSQQFKLRPKQYTTHLVDELFPIVKELSENVLLRSALCISAQYKVKAFMMIRDRPSQVYTTIDHLHPYCIY